MRPIAFACLAGLAALAPAQLQAQLQAETQAKTQAETQAQSALDVEQDAIAADARARALSRDADAADARTRAAEQARIDTAARIQASERRAARVTSRIAILEERQTAQRRRLAARQGEVARLLAALQTLSRRPAGLVLLQPENAVTTARVSALLGTVRPQLAAKTRDLRAELEQTRALRRQLDSAQLKLADARTALVADARRLTTLQAEHRAERDRLDSAADQEQARARSLASRAISLRGLAESIETAADDAIRRPTRRRAPPRAISAALQYRYPATGATLEHFGQPNAGGVRARGMTMRTPENALITAPAAGVVAYAGTFRTYGEIVIIEHAQDMLSMVAGLRRVDVNIGEKLSVGSPLGTMGAVDPQLYLELRRNGKPVDPSLFVTGNADPGMAN